MMFNLFSKDDVLDDTLAHFFTYTVCITGLIVWAIIKTAVSYTNEHVRPLLGNCVRDHYLSGFI